MKTNTSWRIEKDWKWFHIDYIIIYDDYCVFFFLTVNGSREHYSNPMMLSLSYNLCDSDTY